MHAINLRLFRALRQRYLHQTQVDLSGRYIASRAASACSFVPSGVEEGIDF
jgi:hypothetical protein